MKVVGMIPARYGSSRLPGKPLVPILGKAMIQRVYEQSNKARSLEKVFVVTDDERVKKEVEAFGGTALMTAPEHPSGTDRLAEAAAGLDVEIVVNIQGDQPFIDPGMIDEAVAPLLEDPDLPMATILHPIERPEDLADPGVVKTVVDLSGNALYFSRSLIPAPHNPVTHGVYEHVGLYVYRKDFLLKLAALRPTLLERVEGLEQLRVLEHGYKIRTVITACEDNELSGFSIDTVEDIQRGEAMLRERGLA
jgi:3-deoxy-manno-octulosonate cytidylyltransferase (CMP-KDO synthetase)